MVKKTDVEFSPFTQLGEFPGNFGDILRNWEIFLGSRQELLKNILPWGEKVREINYSHMYCVCLWHNMLAQACKLIHTLLATHACECDVERVCVYSIFTNTNYGHVLHD